jgi:competence protein ComGC
MADSSGFTTLKILIYLNIISVLKIILRLLSRSMMSGFQDSTGFFGLT